MKQQRIDGQYIISFEDVGFHQASFDVEAKALEQYVSQAGLPVYRALVTDKTLRHATRELCGIRTCQCGAEGAINVIEMTPQAEYWIEITPEMLSSADWDDLFPNA